ncbi:hypothetical protein K474DRAFT_1656735 [Panus rudis PR-1116 ss-1]|nr:hypothetical protein K474DRAFT_1656735 [Panus rudis PR-1116 ss-1]
MGKHPLPSKRDLCRLIPVLISSATAEVVALTAPHPPTETELSAFGHVAKEIKAAILKSRAHWDKHEPKMWSRVAGISDHDLVDFHVRDNLVEVRDGVTPYGTVLFGKIRIPAVKDGQGEGFVHVR